MNFAVQLFFGLSFKSAAAIANKKKMERVICVEMVEL